MDSSQFDGLVRKGPVDTLPIPDAARQLEAVARYVTQAQEDLTEREKDGDSPALDPEQALSFAQTARAISLTDAHGDTVAVVVSPAVLAVLEDALGLLQGRLDEEQGTAAPLTTDELRDQLDGRMSS
ncbi:hypothetical protein [Streptomyces sp. GSL17-111]|uniref:hypothetical protein n=1 Tax=Streptomyces sp. GSL17-111 TaxID=3121596 RepID=UPI0030F4455D